MTHQALLWIARLTFAPASPLQQVETPFERLVNAFIGLIVVVVVAISLIGFITLLAALLPKASRGSQAALHRAPWRAFFIGLANYLFLGGISLVLLSTELPPLSIPGLLIALFLIGVTAIGLTGLAGLTGERLASMQSQPPSRLKQLIWGVLTLELAGILPFIGWFLLTPILLMVAFGAAVLAWRHRKQDELGV